MASCMNMVKKNADYSKNYIAVLCLQSNEQLKDKLEKRHELAAFIVEYFYDKTLASAPNKPLRLGIAHDFQLVQERLPRQVWDQPLDVLITPLHIRLFKR